MPTNDFLPFCATDTGTNLLTEAEYTASSGRTSGNVPGVASSKLVNKALRQATYITAALAQFLSNATGDNVIDDATQANVLATMGKVWPKTAPTRTDLITGSGTYTPPSGALYLRVRMIGGGGGGGGSGTTGNTGTAGTASFLSSGVLSVGGGSPGQAEIGAAATTTFTLTTGSGVSGKAFQGQAGGGGGINNTTNYTTSFYGGMGASTPFGGGGAAIRGSTAISGGANTGAGGGGAQGYNGSTWQSGGGGAAGAYIEALVSGATLATWISSGATYQVGAGGTGGAAGTSGQAGGAGGSGIIVIEAFYQ